MMSNKLHVAALVATVALTAPAWAQTQSSTGTTSTGTTSATSSSTSGSFQSLSPGNQKIARALFEAQQPTATGPAPLSLNQIADRKGDTGWGNVFKQMKSEGLVDAKNLGQVVSSYEHTSHLTNGTRSGTTVAATTANGRTVTTGSGHQTSSGSSGHGHGDGGEHVSNVSVTTAGGSSAGGSNGASVTHGGGVSGNGGGGAHGR